MFLLRVLCVSLGLVSPKAAPAVAEEHIVVILEAAFFPEQTFVETGDVVRFVNASGQLQTVRHLDGIWTTLPLADGEELLVTIKPGVTGIFTSLEGLPFYGRLVLPPDEATD